jgi:hypothetical protein
MNNDVKMGIVFFSFGMGLFFVIFGIVAIIEMYRVQERCEYLDGCNTGVTKITLNEARKRGMERCSNCSSYYEYMK